jgi:DNA polymerase I-like protein with 3'-5' exonuclease and polymerase domains
MVDVYLQAAAEIFKKDIRDVTDGEREHAKCEALREGYSEKPLVDKLKQVLLLAAEQFELYANEHKAKAANIGYEWHYRQEARKKADVNERWAYKCRAAAGFTP